MRRGVISNCEARRGHWPQLMQRACMRLSLAQSGSVIAWCSTKVSMPLTACSTYGEQSPGSGRKTGGKSGTTTGMLHPADCAPPGLTRECNVGNWLFSKSIFDTCTVCNGRERKVFHRSLKSLRDSHVALTSPPCGAACGVGAVGVFRADRSRETCQARGCRRAPDDRLAPELRRRLQPLEPGRNAPAGSRDRILYRRQDPRVRCHLHVRSPSRQAHS